MIYNNIIIKHDHIHIKLTELESPVIQQQEKIGRERINWTGDTVNLVELAYGIYLTGQLNHGNASLNQIVKWLESNFNINIGVIQRRFAEIAARKRLSNTKFIDQMRQSIIQKIENENE